MVNAKLGTTWREKRLDFKWTVCGPNHLKTGTFEIQTFCPYFRWFLTNWWPFVQTSNGRAFKFQIPLDIWTIYKPASI